MHVQDFKIGFNFYFYFNRMCLGLQWWCGSNETWINWIL